jgi:hypothetical protein
MTTGAVLDFSPMNGCAKLSDMQSFGTALNAWREILARTFADFQRQENASPDWLVNPATNRRLKLDIYYPEIGFAVRFVGLTAKGQRRQSDWEAMESEQRDQTRTELCRRNQVQLFLIEPLEDPVKLMDLFTRLLFRALRAMNESNRPEAERQAWMQKIEAARRRADKLRQSIQRQPEQMMENLGAGWRDRENGLFESTTESVVKRPKAPAVPPMEFVEGMRIRHERFGDGVVTACVPKDGDLYVTILFDGGPEKVLLASLAQDKLSLLD